MDMSRTKTDKDPLKFGIDRLLAAEPFKDNKSVSVAKPLATVPVPCSDCVTSLFRCCRLSPSRQDNVDFLGQHHGFATPTSSIYTVQPIRPFATRPGNYKKLHRACIRKTRCDAFIKTSQRLNSKEI
jgi:hypothetical protein